jgi:heterotetrameric sarcosine oxidase gamma subunit
MRDLENRTAFADLRSVGVGDGVIAIERTGFAAAAVIARRGRSAELSAAVKDAFDIELPTGPQWRGKDGVTMLATGAGKWLALSRAPSDDFVKKLATALRGASVVDQTDGIGIIRLSGHALFATLEKGVQLDIDPETFVAGCAAVTNVAHIGATIWKVDDAPTFDVAVARSLAGSFQHWLETSAGAYGLTVHRRPERD